MNLESFIQILIYLHAFGGFIALTAGFIALSVTKGSRFIKGQAGFFLFNVSIRLSCSPHFPFTGP